MKRIVSLAIGMLAFAFCSTASQAAITSFNVTSVTISKSTGLVTVSGTIQCTAGDTGFVDDVLEQVVGRQGWLRRGLCSWHLYRR
jgi:hypothetical protein